MTMNQSAPSTSQKPLRLWPGITAAVLLAIVRFVMPVVAPDTQLFGLDTALIAVLGGVVLALAIVLWWLLFSRAPWLERLGALVVMIAAAVATRPVMHVSIQNGMMGNMFYVYCVPTTVSLAFVGWAVMSRRLSGGARWAAMAFAILLGCGVWTLARTNGIFGSVADLAWRWSPTAEERLLARAAAEPEIPPVAAAPVVEAPKAESAAAPRAEPVAPAPKPAAATPAPAPAPMTVEWKGFRGADRDDVVRGTAISTDWTASPPVELWRRAVGPGWSSFAVGGGHLFTQEQRGDDEIVACYDASTGKPVWMHKDRVRFWESNGGAGPRATPTLDSGRVYSLGATGVLNALDAATGRVVWTRNAATDHGVKVPGWGFSGSPLVVGDVVVVAVSGALAGYDRSTGAPRWSRKSGGGSYSSPHLVTLDGVEQVLLLNGEGLTSVAPADGTVLWENAWAGVPIVQPAQVAGDILLTTADAMGGAGVRRIAVGHDGAKWNVEERWTSRGLKPYFNDYVVHGGYAYGFDGNILSCIDLADGARKWKGGRYGNGQMLVLADQDVLLVLSEDGELALVRATPEQFTEIARFKAVEGKTWNHPVLVGNTLFVRNGEEMAAFRVGR